MQTEALGLCAAETLFSSSAIRAASRTNTEDVGRSPFSRHCKWRHSSTAGAVERRRPESRRYAEHGGHAHEVFIALPEGTVACRRPAPASVAWRRPPKATDGWCRRQRTWPRRRSEMTRMRGSDGELDKGRSGRTWLRRHFLREPDGVASSTERVYGSHQPLAVSMSVTPTMSNHHFCLLVSSRSREKEGRPRRRRGVSIRATITRRVRTS